MAVTTDLPPSSALWPLARRLDAAHQLHDDVDVRSDEIVERVVHATEPGSQDGRALPPGRPQTRTSRACRPPSWINRLATERPTVPNPTNPILSDMAVLLSESRI